MKVPIIGKAIAQPNILGSTNVKAPNPCFQATDFPSSLEILMKEIAT